MLNKTSLILILLLCFVCVEKTYSKEYKVALFIPQTTPFWRLVEHFTQEAANDLNIKLQIYNAQSNPFLMIDQVHEAVSGTKKVDAIVFPDFRGSSEKIIKIAEKARVYAYSYNAPINQNLTNGGPREKYKYWIGELYPNDKEVSENIMTRLIKKAEENPEKTHNGKTQIVGISGRMADASSQARVEGIQIAINNNNDAILNQVVWNEDWGEKQGEQKALGLMIRYPDATIFWSASYRITNGILSAIKKKNKIPGKDIFTNSIGLTENVLNQVISGEIIATSGGHYIEPAWILVHLYDYFNGIDFADENPPYRTVMPIVTKENVHFFINKVTDEKFSQTNLMKIDFTQYSKTFNPSVKSYQFSLESILNQL